MLLVSPEFQGFDGTGFARPLAGLLRHDVNIPAWFHKHYPGNFSAGATMCSSSPCHELLRVDEADLLVVAARGRLAVRAWPPSRALELRFRSTVKGVAANGTITFHGNGPGGKLRSGHSTLKLHEYDSLGGESRYVPPSLEDARTHGITLILMSEWPCRGSKISLIG